MKTGAIPKMKATNTYLKSKSKSWLSLKFSVVK